MLSIDIGLKHLAHCLIRETIESWDVHNLAPSYTCCSKSTHHLGDLFLCKTCLGNKELPQLLALSNQHESPLGTKKEMIAALKRRWVSNEPDMVEIGKRDYLRRVRLDFLDRLERRDPPIPNIPKPNIPVLAGAAMTGWTFCPDAITLSTHAFHSVKFAINVGSEDGGKGFV